MKAILIDDESLLLDYLEMLLKEIGGIEIVDKCNNSFKGLKAVMQHKPNIVFLDIAMPEINGLELAELIKNISPNSNIVFVTGYAKHAVKALELNALDYIMKPVQRESLVQTINLLSDRNHTTFLPTRLVMICSFKTLHFRRYEDNSQVLDIQWRTTKARELFAYLVQQRMQYVRKDEILDLFWPATDFKDGAAQLYATVYQIRKTLETNAIDIEITSSGNGYLLNINDVKLDVDLWEKAMNQLPDLSRDTLPEYKKVLELYSGDYLIENDFEWAEFERERLRLIWLTHVKKVTDYLMEIGEYFDAITLYLRLQEMYPTREESYYRLMQLYGKIDNRNAVEVQYSKLKKKQLKEHGVEPALYIQNWYQKWRLEI